MYDVTSERCRSCLHKDHRLSPDVWTTQGVLCLFVRTRPIPRWGFGQSGENPQVQAPLKPFKFLFSALRTRFSPQGERVPAPPPPPPAPPHPWWGVAHDHQCLGTRLRPKSRKLIFLARFQSSTRPCRGGGSAVCPGTWGAPRHPVPQGVGQTQTKKFWPGWVISHKHAVRHSRLLALAPRILPPPAM